MIARTLYKIEIETFKVNKTGVHRPWHFQVEWETFWCKQYKIIQIETHLVGNIY